MNCAGLVALINTKVVIMTSLFMLRSTGRWQVALTPPRARGHMQKFVRALKAIATEPQITAYRRHLRLPIFTMDRCYFIPLIRIILWRMGRESRGVYAFISRL